MVLTSRRCVLLALSLLGALSAVLPFGVSSASFTSSSTNPSGSISAAADWTPPVVVLSLPDIIRGTYTLTADATDADSGVKQVVISRSPEDAATWTALCTATASPYACSLNTTTLTDGYYDFQAVATDNAGYGATVVEPSVLVDNTAPTATLGSIAGTVSGVLTLTSTVADAASGVGSVQYQYQPSGAATWTAACLATATPWSCQFDTTKVADGTYAFRAVVTDVAGNTTTTSAATNKKIDNTVSSVSVNPVASFLRGTETITASANSTAGIRTVAVEYQRVGTTTWTGICTATVAPYSCSWNTTSVTSGDYLLRAVLVDGSGKTTTSATVATKVDNSVTRGYDVQAANGGATVGRVDSGDTLTVTYTRQMTLSSIATGWTSGSQAVTIRLRDGAVLGLGAADDTLDVLIGSTAVQLGSVNLKGDFVKSGKTVTFTGTMTAQTVTVNGAPATAVTLTVGSTTRNKDLRTSGALPTMVWTPSSAALDTSGSASSAAAVTELGTVDKDL